MDYVLAHATSATTDDDVQPCPFGRYQWPGPGLATVAPRGGLSREDPPDSALPLPDCERVGTLGQGQDATVTPHVWLVQGWGARRTIRRMQSAVLSPTLRAIGPTHLDFGAK